MPLSASFLMIWLLIFNKKSASITEISTSLLGMFYIGYLPSFWVRLRALENLLPIQSTLFPRLLGHYKWMNVESWTSGSIITWWTWTSIVFADVGAYFVGTTAYDCVRSEYNTCLFLGKSFGKNKLSTVSSAAGSASPNKTIGMYRNRFIFPLLCCIDVTYCRGSAWRFRSVLNAITVRGLHDAMAILAYNWNCVRLKHGLYRISWRPYSIYDETRC